MKHKLLSAITACVLLIGQHSISAQTTVVPARAPEPTLCLTDAVAVAQKYVADNKIDVTQLFLQSATAVYATDNPQGDWLWRIIWAPKENVRGGEIYLFVNKDKSVSTVGGR